MKSLANHNSDISELHWKMNDPSLRKNGIACPECEEELFDSHPMIMLTSNPPQMNIHCECGYVGYRIA